MSIPIEDLISENISDQWNSMVDGKLTFAGVLTKNYHVIVDMPRKWSADSTRKQYLRDYDEYVLPELNEFPLERYEREDYDKVIERVYQKRGIDCKESFVQHIRNIIRRVLVVAEQEGICTDILWGTSYSVESEGAEEELCSKELVRLRKSFTIDEEISIVNAVLDDHTQSGLNFGVALMFCLGIRNAEACGSDFGDIHRLKKDKSMRCLWVYKTTSYDSSQEHYGGKTGNVGRVIPIPSRLDDLLERRRQFLIEKVLDGSLEAIREQDEMDLSDVEFAEAFVDRLPIVCLGDHYTMRCASKELTAAGTAMLREVKIEQEMLALIDYDIRRPGRTEEGIVEKDPTAYACRRNLGTQLYILGLDESEIQYIMGHEIEDDNDERNFYRNEEKLYEIALKMEKRPIVNFEKNSEAVNVTGSFFEEKNVCKTNLVIPIDSEKERVKVVVRKREPQTKVDLNFEYEGIAMTGVRESYDNTEPYSETINVMQEYQKRYQSRIKQRKKADEVNEVPTDVTANAVQEVEETGSELLVCDKDPADHTPRIVVSKVSATPGAVGVQVAVYLENNPGFEGMELAVLYDESALKLVDARNGSAAEKYLIRFPDELRNRCTFRWSGNILEEPENFNGEILLLTFDVMDTTAFGTYSIELAYYPSAIYGWDWNNVTFELVAGSISVFEATSNIQTEERKNDVGSSHL